MHFSKQQRNPHFKRLKKAQRKDTYWWFALQSKVCSPCPGLQQRSWRDRLFQGSGQWLQQKSSWWWAVSGRAGQGGWQGSPPPDSRTLGSGVGSTWWWSWCQKPPQTADLWGKALHLKAQGYNNCQRESLAGGEVIGFCGWKKRVNFAWTMTSPGIFTKLNSQGNLTVNMPTHIPRQADYNYKHHNLL